MKKLLLLALLTAMLFSCDNGDIVTISGGSLPEPLDMAFTDKMMSVGTWGMCLTYFSDEATLTIGLANASFSGLWRQVADPIDDIMDRLPSAVESYLKNKGGLSTGEIDKLRGILSIED